MLGTIKVHACEKCEVGEEQLLYLEKCLITDEHWLNPRDDTIVAVVNIGK